MGASGRVARDPSECGGAPSRLSATRCRAPSRDSPSRPARDPSARQRRRDAAPPTAPRPLLQARLRDRFWAHAGQIEAQSGAARHARGQEAQGAPSRRGAGARDQALPLRLWPAPVAADAPPPSAHGPVRYARPSDLYESVCALSPMELMYHLYEMPAELANISLPVVQ